MFDGGKAKSILDVAPDLAERTLLINGASKTYAMTGIRIGWAVGPKPLIAAIQKLQADIEKNPDLLEGTTTG